MSNPRTLLGRVAIVAFGAIASLTGGGCNGGRTPSPDASDARPTDDVAAVVLGPDEIFGHGLVLWLDASDSANVITDGGTVIRWRSRALPLGSEVVAAYPFLAYNGITIDSSAANGRPAIRVGGQRGMFESPRSSGFSWSTNFEMLVAIVASYTNPPTQTGVMFMMQPVDVYVRGNAMGRSIVIGGLGETSGAVSSASEGWNDGKLHTFGFRMGARDVGNGNAALRTDGIQWTSPGAAGDRQSMLMIGGRDCDYCDAGPTQIEEPLEGYIAEVIMAVNTAGTPTQLAQLSAYFQKKYGIPF